MCQSINRWIRLGLLPAIVVTLPFLSGCKREDRETEADKKSRILQGTWSMESVTVDGVDRSTIYEGLTLSFTLSTYTTTNGLPVWPEYGTWRFEDVSARIILRDELIRIEVVEVSPAKLTLKFPWEDTTFGPGGRGNSVAGEHIFTFSR